MNRFEEVLIKAAEKRRDQNKEAELRRAWLLKNLARAEKERVQ